MNDVKTKPEELSFCERMAKQIFENGIQKRIHLWNHCKSHVELLVNKENLNQVKNHIKNRYYDQVIQMNMKK